MYAGPFAPAPQQAVPQLSALYPLSTSLWQQLSRS